MVKAQEMYTSLSNKESLDYKVVKSMLLRARTVSTGVPSKISKLEPVSLDNPDEEDEVDVQPLISQSSVSLTIEDVDQ